MLLAGCEGGFHWAKVTSLPSEPELTGRAIPQICKILLPFMRWDINWVWLVTEQALNRIKSPPITTAVRVMLVHTVIMEFRQVKLVTTLRPTIKKVVA